MYIKFKRTTQTSLEPTHGSALAAGYDLYADIDSPVTIAPHETLMIDTGIAFEIPAGFFGGVYPRSGISTKRGLRLANCTGVIDADYRGSVHVPLHNDTEYHQTVYPHERVAQIIFQQCMNAILIESDALSETDRGSNGFGSTGRN